MTHLPILRNLDLLLAFAGTPPSVPAYEAIAEEHQVTVLSDAVEPAYRLFKRGDFRLALVDRNLARVHVVGYFPSEDELDEDEDEHSRHLGISVVSSGQELRDAYDAILHALVDRLGEPAVRGSYMDALYIDTDEEVDEDKDDSFEYSYAAWSVGNALLTLLSNSEGDLQIDEWATVDLRISSTACSDTLPESISEPFAWPNDP